MSSGTTLILRVPPKLKKRLDLLAKRRKITHSRVALDAVEQYVSEFERQESLIEKADAEILDGKTIPHELIRRWLLSWGTEKELAPPSCK
jgi:predicted transcriptional regulator